MSEAVTRLLEHGGVRSALQGTMERWPTIVLFACLCGAFNWVMYQGQREDRAGAERANTELIGTLKGALKDNTEAFRELSGELRAHREMMRRDREYSERRGN